MNQVLDRFSKLPRSQRALLFVVGYVIIAIVAFFVLVSPTMDAIGTAEAKQAELTKKRDDAQERASNRKAFQEEYDRVKERLDRAMQELPDQREIPQLLSDIDANARTSGLDVRRFQPLPEVRHEYYAEVPVQIAMDGGFHEVAKFFERVAKMNRIVSVKDIVIGEARENGGETDLTITGKVVTFRFLSDDEIAAQKEADKSKDKKKKKGGE